MRPLSLTRRALVAVAALLATATACGGSSPSTTPAAADGGDAAAEVEGEGGTLVIGMTAANIPGTDSTLAMTEGGEGLRFVGFQLYDGLTRFDLTRGDRPPEVVPGLAERWEASEDLRTWTFFLRPGVTFHDGTPWDAEAAIFNFDRFLDESSPHYYPELNGIAASIGLRGIESYRLVDDMTIEITTKRPYVFLPDDLTTILFQSPTAVQEHGNEGVASAPAGTGPFRFESMERGRQLVMTPNTEYWGEVPKLDRLIVRPIPDATARSAALRAGEVNWIEVPPPDEVPQLRSSFTVHTNTYSHLWPWLLDTTEPPFDDPDVRRAVNLAIDREAMATNLLNDTAIPMTQFAGPADAGYDESLEGFEHDPDEARRLLAEAGYPDGFDMTLLFPTSGSGNMVPIPMNEALQRDLAEIGVDVELEPIEWSSLIATLNQGGMPAGVDAVNISLAYIWPSLWSRSYSSESVRNNGRYSNPEVDALLTEVEATADPDEREALYRRINELLIADAPWLVVVHDLNPRVTTNDVHGFVQPQSWFVDLTTVWVDE